MLRNMDKRVRMFGNLNQYDRKIQEINRRHKPAKHAAKFRFDSLEYSQINDYTGFDSRLQLNARLRWTPLIQIFRDEISLDLKQNINKFESKKVFDHEDEDQLIDMQIQEVVYNSGFEIKYSYQCEQTSSIPFYGTIDYLIYHKQNRLPFLPILKTKKKTSILSGHETDYWDPYEATAVGLWILNFAKDLNNEVKTQKVLQTNGHQWRIYELDSDWNYRHTGIYRSSINQFGKLYGDDYQLRLNLGIINYCLYKTEKQLYLEDVYRYIDEQMYSKQPQKEQIKGNIDKSQKYRWIPQIIRNKLFKY